MDDPFFFIFSFWFYGNSECGSVPVEHNGLMACWFSEDTRVT